MSDLSRSTHPTYWTEQTPSAACSVCEGYRLRFPALLSLDRPMQVVVPSVSLAATLQGAVFTGLRGTVSSADLSALPVVSGGPLTGGAAPTVGGAIDGGAVIGGGAGNAPVVPGVCCAKAGNETSATEVTATETLKVANRIGASLETITTTARERLRQRPGSL